MAIQKIRLGDICEFIYGKGLPKNERISGEFPVYGSGGIVDNHKNYYVKGPGIIVGRKGNKKLSLSRQRRALGDNKWLNSESG